MPSRRGRRAAPIQLAQYMTLYPTWEEFKDFTKYVTSIEAKGAHEAGIVKIIPPPEWVPCKQGYNLDTLDIILESPIKQVFTSMGNKGAYQTKSIVKPHLHVKSFIEKANATKFRTPFHKSAGDLERKYWQTLALSNPIYGADVNQTLMDNSCDVWNIGRLDNILRILGNAKIPGVTTSYLYFGMWKATFSWHVEDMDLYAINFLHYGMPKTWYCVPPKYGYLLEECATELFPGIAKLCNNFLRHKTCLIVPSVLDEFGVPYQKVIQEERDIVIVFPYAYHSGFNHGFNIAESTNFALERWVEYGKRYRSCDCSSLNVKIDIGIFVKRYQPDRYDDWLAGKDIAAHPEDPPHIVERLKLKFENPQEYKRLMRHRIKPIKDVRRYTTKLGRLIKVNMNTGKILAKKTSPEELKELAVWIEEEKRKDAYIRNSGQCIDYYLHIEYPYHYILVDPRSFKTPQRMWLAEKCNQENVDVESLIQQGILVKVGSRRKKQRNFVNGRTYCHISDTSLTVVLDKTLKFVEKPSENVLNFLNNKPEQIGHYINSGQFVPVGNQKKIHKNNIIQPDEASLETLPNVEEEPVAKKSRKEKKAILVYIYRHKTYSGITANIEAMSNVVTIVNPSHQLNGYLDEKMKIYHGLSRELCLQKEIEAGEFERIEETLMYISEEENYIFGQFKYSMAFHQEFGHVAVCKYQDKVLYKFMLDHTANIGDTVEERVQSINLNQCEWKDDKINQQLDSNHDLQRLRDIIRAPYKIIEQRLYRLTSNPTNYLITYARQTDVKETSGDEIEAVLAKSSIYHLARQGILTDAGILSNVTCKSHLKKALGGKKTTFDIMASNKAAVSGKECVIIVNREDLECIVIRNNRSAAKSLYGNQTSVSRKTKSQSLETVAISIYTKFIEIFSQAEPGHTVTIDNSQYTSKHENTTLKILSLLGIISSEKMIITIYGSKVPDDVLRNIAFCKYKRAGQTKHQRIVCELIRQLMLQQPVESYVDVASLSKSGLLFELFGPNSADKEIQEYLNIFKAMELVEIRDQEETLMECRYIGPRPSDITPTNILNVQPNNMDFGCLKLPQEVYAKILHKIPSSGRLPVSFDMSYLLDVGKNLYDTNCIKAFIHRLNMLGYLSKVKNVITLYETSIPEEVWQKISKISANESINQRCTILFFLKCFEYKEDGNAKIINVEQIYRIYFANTFEMDFVTRRLLDDVITLITLDLIYPISNTGNETKMTRNYAFKLPSNKDVTKDVLQHEAIKHESIDLDEEVLPNSDY